MRDPTADLEILPPALSKAGERHDELSDVVGLPFDGWGRSRRSTCRIGVVVP